MSKRISNKTSRFHPFLAITLAFVATVVGIGKIPTQVSAGDWPQILGPHRNGQADDEMLAAKWPADGPPVVWSYDVGEGYAGPAVAGKKVVIFHRVKGNERLEALDVQTGKSLWIADFETRYSGGIDRDTGPRCVPVIHAGNIYVFGAAGVLHCVSLETGKPRWTRDAYSDFGGDTGYFGAGSSPLVAGDKLLVNVGGSRSGAGLVAFSLETGKDVWKKTNEAASYSSPTLAMIGGKPTAIFVTRMNCVAVDPETGATKFSFPFGKRGPTVNAATPLVFDDHLFVTASYGVGAVYAKLEPTAAKQIWTDDETMSSQYTTCVYRDGFLYGVHGREDFANGELRCFDPKTGKVQWKQAGFGIANPILAGDKLLLIKTDGQVVLADASPASYKQLATATISNDITRSLPALSNGKLFVRTNSERGGKLMCLSVGKN